MRPVPDDTVSSWGDGQVARGPRPGKEPAKGDPYNWTQMGLAVVIMLLMLALVLWLIRRNRRPS